MPDRGEPTTEYTKIVIEATKDIAEFNEDDASFLALSCWRNDWPFKKEHFEGDAVQFSDDDTQTLSDWLEKVDAFVAEFEGDGGTSHYHGDFSHSHSGGEISHQHEGHAGAYSITKTASTNASEGNMKFSEAVATSLGLGETASETDVISAIAALKGSSFSEDEKAAFEEMRLDRRVTYWAEQTEGHTLAIGTTKERATKLAKLENDVSEDEAKERLAEFQAFHDAATTAGITDTILSSSDSDNAPGAIAKKIKEYAEKHEISENEALAKLATEDSKILTAYSEELAG